MKLCKSCDINKHESDFTKCKGNKDGLQFYCKECCNLKNKTSYSKNKDKKSTYRKDRYIKNKTIELTKNKEWRIKNVQKNRADAKLYYQKNKAEINLKRKKRSQNNSKIRIDSNVRLMVRNMLRGQKARRSWKDLVGYSDKVLFVYLESKFTKGMNWDNYGKGGWHIDHIIPKKLFKYNSAEHPAFKACWALSNLQPLWESTTVAISYGESTDYIGNLEKGDRINITTDIQKILDDVNK
jgi:hypothetical protein